MASRMIHYVISKNILKQIEVKDESRFIIGSLAPDACSHEDGSYDICHFKGVSQDGAYKGVNWRGFENKYGENLLEDSMYLGYFCHLIEDAVWLCDMANKYVRKYSRDIRSNYYAMGYRDYARLNKLLVSEYHLDVPDFAVPVIPIKEVKEEYVKNHFEGFLNDFVFDTMCGKEELELYHWNLIEEYIERCTNLCIEEIEALKNQRKRINPEKYYVSVD